jgi:hypothetical protein
MAVTTTRKKPPTGKGLTYEKVWAMFQETDRQLKENAERQKETDRLIKENAERQKETERLIKENAEQQKETERQMKESAERLDKQLGRLGNRIGELVEHLVAPNTMEKFNELGYCFTKTGTNIKITDPKTKKADAEVDILLENGDIVIAMEVKSRPNTEDVNDHVQRMEVLRRYADNRQDNRRYQGAVAGALISKEVRRYILEKGFYVIEQTGDTVRINIPKGFKAREW